MRTRGIVAALALAAGLTTGLWLWLSRIPEGHGAIAVTLGGRSVELPAGTTLSGMLGRLHVNPKSGDLLDVHGSLLRVGHFPGYVLLDGVQSPGDTVLRDGDRVVVVDGIDNEEPVHSELDRVESGRASDPEFFLSRTPGEEVAARGAVSGTMLFAYFRPTGKPVPTRDVALTFDDGPWPGTTRRILAILRHRHAPATFFTIGRQVDLYPQLLRDERAAGMSVGDHSFSHPERPPFAQLGRRRVRAEIADGAAAVQRATGSMPTLFRPPGGSYSDAVVSIAGELGMRVVLWSVDPNDWRPGVTPTQLVRRVLRAVRPGSIVLLHDGGGDRSATVKALPSIIAGIRRMRLRLVTVS